MGETRDLQGKVAASTYRESLLGWLPPGVLKKILTLAVQQEDQVQASAKLVIRFGQESTLTRVHRSLFSKRAGLCTRSLKDSSLGELDSTFGQLMRFCHSLKDKSWRRWLDSVACISTLSFSTSGRTPTGLCELSSDASPHVCRRLKRNGRQEFKQETEDHHDWNIANRHLVRSDGRTMTNDWGVGSR
jgi:hypothetical protein